MGRHFDRLEAALLEAAREEAGRYGLGLEVEALGKHLPTPMSPGIQEAIERACRELGLQHTRLSSGAGHDAQSLAGLCPVGMFFVPSMGGASHSAREFTHWQDCLNGANVLLGAVLNLASG
jgi:beta-ureidopropionase / N-carbamoyl-L-amino-acid hydrolase